MKVFCAFPFIQLIDNFIYFFFFFLIAFTLQTRGILIAYQVKYYTRIYTSMADTYNIKRAYKYKAYRLNNAILWMCLNAKCDILSIYGKITAELTMKLQIRIGSDMLKLWSQILPILYLHYRRRNRIICVHLWPNFEVQNVLY